MKAWQVSSRERRGICRSIGVWVWKISAAGGAQSCDVRLVGRPGMGTCRVVHSRRGVTLEVGWGWFGGGGGGGAAAAG